MTEHIDGICSKCGEAIAVDIKTTRGYCPNCKDQKTPLKGEEQEQIFLSKLYGIYWIDDSDSSKD